MSNEAHEKGILAAEQSYWDCSNDPEGDRDMEKAVKAYLDASGQVIVPREGTDGMYDAGLAAFELDSYHMSTYHCVGEAYSAMVEAAPNPFESNQDE